MEIKINNKKIKIYLGDITELKVDAIVNAANNHGYMGGGVAGAIKRNGGKIIEDEAISKGPVSVGEAFVTNAGRLRARYVIHAAGMGLDFKTDKTKIRDATLNSLRRAEELKIKSIVFPSIGTGVGHFPVDKVAEIMINVVKEHLKGKTGIETVIFALYTKRAYDEFEKALKCV